MISHYSEILRKLIPLRKSFLNFKPYLARFLKIIFTQKIESFLARFSPIFRRIIWPDFCSLFWALFIPLSVTLLGARKTLVDISIRGF